MMADLRALYVSWCTLPMGLRCWLVFVHLITFDVLRLGVLMILGNLHIRCGA